MDPRISQLAEAIPHAVEQSLLDVIRHIGDENLYAFALFTNDALDSLYPIANTIEQLELTVKHYNEFVDPKFDGSRSSKNGMLWSYGDWKIDGIGKERFNDANHILRELTDEKIDIYFNNPDDPRYDKIMDNLWEVVETSFANCRKNEILESQNIDNVTFLIVGDLLDEENENCSVERLNPDPIVQAYLNWQCDG